jgi:hypothetical protein
MRATAAAVAGLSPVIMSRRKAADFTGTQKREGRKRGSEWTAVQKEKEDFHIFIEVSIILSIDR